MRIGRTMTIVESGDGLIVFNAVRLSESEERKLDQLGKVKHLVKLSDSHGIDEPYYVSRYKPEVWAPSGSKDTRVEVTRRLGPDLPVAGAVVVEYPGARGWRECGVWVPHSTGTLITCDALQNHTDAEGSSFLGKIMTPLLGFKGGLIVAPMWRRLQKVQGAAVRTAFGQLTELAFENLVTGHGPAFLGNADRTARAAIERAAS